jgi:hypothetical protein
VTSISFRSVTLFCAAVSVWPLAADAAARRQKAEDKSIPTAPAVPWPVALKSIAYDSNQEPFTDLDKAIGAAGQDRVQLGAIETQITALLNDPAITAAGRDGLTARLALVLPADPPAASPALAVLAKMLTVEAQADFARQALEPVPGAAIDAVLQQALARTAGKTRLGIIWTLGVRQTTGAVPVLAPLLADTDVAAAAATARALGLIGGPAALTALQKAPAPTKPVVVQATLEVAGRLPAADAAAVFSGIHQNGAMALHLRAAALRGLIRVEPARAVERIVAAVAGDELEFREVALEAVTAQEGPAVSVQLADRLRALKPAVQTAVLAALARKGDAVVVPSVVGALADADAGVRRAALAALGFLPGNADIAARLAKIAAEADGDEAKAAAASLARLRGSGVAEAVRAGAAATADIALQVVYLKQLAARNATEELPLLWSLQTAVDVKVRTAAVDALGEIAPPADQRKILDWALRAKDAQEQTRAARALVNVTLRQSEEATRAQVVIDAIDRGDAAAKVVLLPTLQRLGGKAALACAVAHTKDADTAVADAAIDVLVRWSDAAALQPLVTLAEQAVRAEARSAAVNGAIRLYERATELKATDRSDALARLLKVAGSATTRNRVIRLLGACKDKAALAAVDALAGDKEVGAEARDAADSIRANLLWPPVFTASGSVDDLKNIGDGKTTTRWSVPADAGQWLQVDFKVARPIRTLTLDQSGRNDEFPEHYEVFVTDDPKTPGTVRVQGKGQSAKTVLRLPKGVRGRYVLIKNTETRPDSNWTVSELAVE